jgi:hypothetical protein
MNSNPTHSRPNSQVREPLDRLTGGRGTYILGGLLVLVLAGVLAFFFAAIFRLLAFLFPTTFGGAAAATATTTLHQATFEAPKEVVLDEDFFQQNDDL